MKRRTDMTFTKYTFLDVVFDMIEKPWNATILGIFKITLLRILLSYESFVTFFLCFLPVSRSPL